MTKRACVIGHPVAHSRSPMIHRHWLNEHGIDGDYVQEDVLPEKLASFLATLAERGYAGANITVPHKAAAFQVLQEADDVAHALKVTNTVWHAGGTLYGTNTDVYGFLAHLDESAPDWKIQAEQSVVIGAGGAARAVVYGLLERGVSRVVVVNRTPARSEALATEFNGNVTVADFDSLPAWLKDADLLVNTTSLGMTGQPPLDIDLSHLNRTATVYDIVYVPLETPLLAQARERGLRTVDGLGMLLHQAVPAFERFFGMRPSVTPALRAAVLADLARKSHA
jgi:shikimate dehydrogenase